MPTQYDVAVIGGGPGGYSTAIKASQLGAKVVLFEKSNLGGTCLNVGCIPTKCLVEKAQLLEMIRRDTEDGILKEAGLYSWKKILNFKDATVKQLITGIGGVMESYGVKVVKCAAELCQPDIVEAGKERYYAKNIVIATGSKNLLPAIPGIDGTNVIDSTAALSLAKVPQSLIIIGGGVIGLEFAGIYNSFGSKVTVIEMLDSIVFTEDRECTAFLSRSLGRKGIRIINSSKVEKISDDSGQKIVYFKNDLAMQSVKGDYVLVSVGRSPNLEGISLSGLMMDNRGYIRTDDKMRTSIPNVYAVGDITGENQLAHAAFAQAEVVAQNCMGGNEQVDLRIMPRCIFSLPQMSSVGKTEEQLRSENVNYCKGVFPYAGNGKALAAGESSGMVKVLTDKDSHIIIGVHIVGANASELLSAAILAIKNQLRIEDFEKTIFPHPTMSEMVKEAVLAAENKATNLRKGK